MSVSCRAFFGLGGVLNIPQRGATPIRGDWNRGWHHQHPLMTEIKFFRLLLVVLAAMAIGLGGGIAWSVHQQREAETAISLAFGDYNRYVAACADPNDDTAADLAERAHEKVAKLSAVRDGAEERAQWLMWTGIILGPALVALFYAVRWAMTGRIRPLWLLAKSGKAAE